MVKKVIPVVKKQKYRSKVKKVCPIHKCKLVGSYTIYGLRFECPEVGCTVVCWSGSTSTPADYETRSMRISVGR
ncbi:hypothetical protein LCGC14_2919230 [marine sediment metagenome]|uniref:Uncharacterized protein n=1 Tax=marine sediment metagenome TaxID=412755 RepID=A0A0F8YB80_9ZZZZ